MRSGKSDDLINLTSTFLYLNTQKMLKNKFSTSIIDGIYQNQYSASKAGISI